jgi:hypothetical protein
MFTSDYFDQNRLKAEFGQITGVPDRFAPRIKVKIHIQYAMPQTPVIAQ